MAVKPLTAMIGQNYGVRLAPDLTWFTDRSQNARSTQITSIDCSAGLTTLLSLTGKFELQLLYMDGLTTNDIDQIKLTMDGVVIWNTDGMSVNTTLWSLMGKADGDTGPHGLICHTSFLLEMETTADTAINFVYMIRPIL